MARPAVRSARLDPEIRTAILRAFGTQLNAYWQLDRNGLLSQDKVVTSSVVTPSTFARALRGDTVTQEQAARIQLAWDVRRVQPVAA